MGGPALPPAPPCRAALPGRGVVVMAERLLAAAREMRQQQEQQQRTDQAQQERQGERHGERQGERVRLVATGALTNVALALELYPGKHWHGAHGVCSHSILTCRRRGSQVRRCAT